MLTAQPPQVHIRALAARDSFDAMTALLHRAYAPLAARGLNFTAATQSPETTRKRAAEGQCLVAEAAGAVVGTITVSGPFDADSTGPEAAASWFLAHDTAHFHQFGVDPAHQRQGLGRRLVQACEDWARDNGYRFMALDTAEPATELHALYRRMGYEHVGDVQWPGKRYRSVIMRKTLDRSPLRDLLQTQARYHLWATQALYQHVDTLPEVFYRQPTGLFFGSVHGTLNHLAVADHIWFARFARDESPALALNAEVEPERLRLRRRLLDAAAAWQPLIGSWPEAYLLGRMAYRRTDGQAMNLPLAATLAHVFNHGTHHRGQVTAALTAGGFACPALDLAWMLNAENPQAVP